jgi:hypothetical protein
VIYLLKVQLVRFAMFLIALLSLIPPNCMSLQSQGVGISCFDSSTSLKSSINEVDTILMCTQVNDVFVMYLLFVAAKMAVVINLFILIRGKLT